MHQDMFPLRRTSGVFLPYPKLTNFRKIENFIRTKYESKRWVMDGPMPDPSTLDGDGDEDVVRALNIYHAGGA